MSACVRVELNDTIVKNELFELLKCKMKKQRTVSFSGEFQQVKVICDKDMFKFPLGVKISLSRGLLFIADSTISHNQIQIYCLQREQFVNTIKLRYHPRYFDLCDEKDFLIVGCTDHCVYRVDLNSLAVVWSSGTFRVFGDELHQFNFPMGIAIDRFGQLAYVCDMNNNRIQVLNTTNGLVLKSLICDEELQVPWGITINNHGDLIVTEVNHNRIRVISREDGKELYRFGSLGNDKGELRGPVAVIFDRKSCNILVCDSSRIQTFAESGLFLSSSQPIGGCFGMCMDEEKGILFVSQNMNHAVGVYK